MDRVTESLLNEFVSEHELTNLAQEKAFEHFVCFVTVGRHYSESFDTEDIVVGAGGDTGIDGIAIIVNGELISDVEDLDDTQEVPELDVTFVFVQADRGAGFDAAKIGSFGFGVTDFFKDMPSLPRNERVAAAAEIMSAIYGRSSKFKRGNPICRLYFATTGRWTDDPTLEGRRTSVIADLEATNLFREVTFTALGAEGLQRLYRQTKNAIAREFIFENRVVVPEIAGISQAYLGFLPVPEFLKIISDDTGEMIGSLFYSNPRDWQDYNEVNSEIKTTLQSEGKNRFVLMNNGITIIARDVRPTGNKFVIEDYQIVNGCQTSHVVYEQAEKNDRSVMVPVRLIGTQDESIINAIIRATNRQTEVKEDQFFALQEFPKQLELFFQTFPTPFKLYYERRSRQYDKLPIEKTRIITQPNVIRAFAAMFLDEAHRTTRNYSALKAKVGKDIFGQGHRMEPYYAAAFALYKLEYLFRNGKLDPKYKPARFHILLAARILANPGPLPRMNSHDMERYCRPLIERLWDANGADELMTAAVQAVDEAAAGNFDRDNIRTESFTTRIVELCRSAGTT